MYRMNKMRSLRRHCCTKKKLLFLVIFLIIFLHIALLLSRMNKISIIKDEDKLSAYKSSVIGQSPYSVIVSYAIYAPPNGLDNSYNVVYARCEDNLNRFLARAITIQLDVDYVFSLIGDNTRELPRLNEAAKKFPNIHIVTTQRVNADLIVHGHIMKNYIDSKAHFIMLNCGSRGPYYNKTTSITGRDTWIEDLLFKLDGTTKAIGSTISCEVSVHIQSYFIAVDRDAAKVLIDLWAVKDISKLTKLEIIRMSEVGASKALLDKGYNINSLESRYNNVDFRQGDYCKLEFEGMELYNTGTGPQFKNPTVCRHRGHPGCSGAEPCEVMFVKFGGEALRDGLLSNTTIRNVEREDRAVGGMCGTPVAPLLPYFNISHKWDRIMQYKDNNRVFQSDFTSHTFVLIPILHDHTNLGEQLKIKLIRLKMIKKVKIRVTIFCISFELETKVLLELAKTGLSLNLADVEEQRIVISVLKIPNQIYNDYSRYKDKLCLNMYKQYYKTLGYSNMNMDDSCTMNLPLYYLLLDMLLHYIKQFCYGSRLVIISNYLNDNSKNTYNSIISKWIEFDVIISTATQNNKRRSLQLAIKMTFLKESKLTFLGSIAKRPLMNDYYNAEKSFLKFVGLNRANILKLNS